MRIPKEGIIILVAEPASRSRQVKRVVSQGAVLFQLLNMLTEVFLGALVKETVPGFILPENVRSQMKQERQKISGKKPDRAGDDKAAGKNASETLIPNRIQFPFDEGILCKSRVFPECSQPARLGG